MFRVRSLRGILKCFSLIEVVVVICVLAILSAYAFSSYSESNNEVRNEVTSVRLDDFKNAQFAYLAKYGVFSDNPNLLEPYYKYPITNGLTIESGTVSVFVDDDGNLWYAVKGDECFVRFVPHPLSNLTERDFSNSEICSASIQAEN